MEPADRARQIAEGISCVLNVLAPFVWPERFGALSADQRTDATKHISALREALEGDLSNIQADVKLQKVQALLPEIELAFAAGADPEKQAQVAREFFEALNVAPNTFPSP